MTAWTISMKRTCRAMSRRFMMTSTAALRRHMPMTPGALIKSLWTRMASGRSTHSAIGGTIMIRKRDCIILAAGHDDPETGRFLNADMTLDPRSFSGYNAFAYCLNCPVRYRMPSGRSAVSALGDDTGRWTSFYRTECSGTVRCPGRSAGGLLDEATRRRAPVHC